MIILVLHVSAHRETSTMDDPQKNQVQRKIWPRHALQMLSLDTIAGTMSKRTE